jgi:hypothetical protein
MELEQALRTMGAVSEFATDDRFDGVPIPAHRG